MNFSLTRCYCRKIFGRGVSHTKTEMAHIMWTSVSVPDQQLDFNPNHFVPLLFKKKMNKSGIIYLKDEMSDAESENEEPVVTPLQEGNDEDEEPVVTLLEEGNDEDEEPVVTLLEEGNDEDEEPVVTLLEEGNDEDEEPVVTLLEEGNDEDEEPVVTLLEEGNDEDEEPVLTLLEEGNDEHDEPCVTVLQEVTDEDQEPAKISDNSVREYINNVATGTLSNQWLSTNDTINILRYHRPIIEKIPLGPKEYVFFLVDHTDNMEQRRSNNRCSYTDACGAWVSGGPTAKYICNG